MSTEQSQSPIGEEAVLRAKQEIQGLMHEIVDLSKTEVDPSQFYAAVIDKSVTALAAIGGVAWVQDESGPLKLEYQVNLRQTGLAESQNAQIQHGRLLQQVLDKGEAILVPPHSGTVGGEDGDEQGAANPTEFLLVIAPIVSDRGVDGLVEIFQRPGARPTTQRGYLRFLNQVCEVAGEYVKTRRLRHFATKQSLWEQLEAFTSLVHQKLDSRETAYTIANEGRRLIGCDRVTVVLRKGSKYRVAAISGQDTFDKRSNVVRLLQNLATTVARTGEDLWFEGDTSDLAPQVEKAVNAYVDESHTKQLAVLPLREAVEEEEKPGEKVKPKRENILGAIIIEQLVDSRTPEGMLQRIDVVRRHSSTSLTNAQYLEGLFLLPLWRMLGKTRVLVTARNLPKTVLALIAITGLVAALSLVPYEFTVVADGKLLPERRDDIFAGLDGTVKELLVDHGDLVRQGQVLARMESVDLDQQIAQIRGETQEVIEQIGTVKRERDIILNRGSQNKDVEVQQLAGRMAQLQVKLDSLGKQKQMLEEKKKRLTVTAPIDGKVVTWELRKLLENRPVRQGQMMMKLADPTSPWELEIYVPEAKMGHIVSRLRKLREQDPQAKLKVDFILETHSSETLTGVVERIATQAEVRGEDGNTVQMRVSFAQKDLERLVENPAEALKVGADVKAKVRCGEHAVGYVLFSDLFEFVQSRILFRL